MNGLIILLNLIFGAVARHCSDWLPLSPASAPQNTDQSGFPWPAAATVTGALIAAIAVVGTLLVNAARARRESNATLYAVALGSVAEYVEGPYRILRKDGTATTRFAITSKISDVKASIDHSQALLRLHAPDEIADAYDDYVTTAQREAGRQMHEAWKAAAVESDAAVNLFDPLPRGDSVASRLRLVEIIQADLRRRWYRPKSRSRYADAAQACLTAGQAQSVHEQEST